MPRIAAILTSLLLVAAVSCADGEPEEQAPPGLGLNVNDVVDMFEERGYKLHLESAPLRDGTPRWFASPSHKLVSLELIGDKSDLQQISLNVVVGEGFDFLGASTSLLIRNVLPDWEDSKAWMAWGVSRFVDDPDQVFETTHGNASITLRFYQFLSSVSLIIKAKQPPIDSPAG